METININKLWTANNKKESGRDNKIQKVGNIFFLINLNVLFITLLVILLGLTSKLSVYLHWSEQTQI